MRKNLQAGHVTVLGATSFVGELLLPMLVDAGLDVTAVSRRPIKDANPSVKWHVIDHPGNDRRVNSRSYPQSTLICVAPIWILPDYLSKIPQPSLRRIIALSSTSRFSKQDCSDPENQALALRLAKAESEVETWANDHGVEWVILRPTLIYGLGKDKNVSEIARFISRFGFFPVFGKATGLRQPIHGSDVAAACHACLTTPNQMNKAFNLSGGETLTYSEMVRRIFVALKRPYRILPIPLSIFRLAIRLLRILPKYKKINASMVERMEKDLVFDHSDATKEFGFAPIQFSLTKKDLP